MSTTYVTVQQAAKELCLSVRAVQTRIAKGHITATKISEGRTSPYLIPSAELTRLKREQVAARALRSVTA